MKKKAVKKVVKKKIVKKTIKKAIKKVVKKPAVLKVLKEKPVGVVTHFYGHISVAIIKFSKPVKVGDSISFRGATTSFSQEISSMQYEHESITVAKAKQEVGLKVKKRVREGDEVFIS